MTDINNAQTIEVNQAQPAVVHAVKSPKLLTPRQIEVLQGIASGKTRKQIADDMKDPDNPEKSLSMKTVEYHAMQMMNKLGIYSVALLTQYALATKLVEPHFKATFTEKMEPVVNVDVEQNKNAGPITTAADLLENEVFVTAMEAVTPLVPPPAIIPKHKFRHHASTRTRKGGDSKALNKYAEVFGM